jgi:DNA ligase (NAD+)
LPDETLSFCVEPKFDGASISLIFENDLLIRATTRGDGVRGDDITLNAKQIKSIPLSIPASRLGIIQMEIRGEALISKNKFEQYNKSLIAEGQPPLANPRNAASGSLRMKDPAEVSKRGLDVYLYHVSYITSTGAPLESHYEILRLLDELGFRSSLSSTKLCHSLRDVVDMVNEYEEKRDELPYEIDGMVIKLNSLVHQEKVGQTSHHPRWAIAYKFKARQATSKLIDVEYQVGRTGSVTPVAKIEPVFIGGVTVSSISLHNSDLIEQKDIRIGDTVLVERAGDVIPQIVHPITDLRNGTEKKIVFPSHCPVCKSPLEKPEEEAVWRCSNEECAAQAVERIIHFASKDAMDIRGLGDALIRKFYDLNILKNIEGIYSLPYDEIKKMEGLGEKSVIKLQDSIETSKAQPLHRIIFGLGIRYVGETTAKTLANSIKNIEELYNKTEEDLKQLEDIGEKVASSVFYYFQKETTRDRLKNFREIGLQLINQKKSEIKEGNLSGKSFLFTGTLSRFKRSKAEEIVEQQGGQILGSVSAKLNYLVVGADAGSKLEKAKKLTSVQVLSEDEFLKLIGNELLSE